MVHVATFLVVLTPTLFNYDPNACYDDGSCIQPVLGCTDPSAANFDPLANVDDGLCCYGNDNLTINITTDNYPTETRWYITNQNGVEIDGINSGDLLLLLMQIIVGMFVLI